MVRPIARTMNIMAQLRVQRRSVVSAPDAPRASPRALAPTNPDSPPPLPSCPRMTTIRNSAEKTYRTTMIAKMRVTIA